jgi:transposase-like protein
MKTSILDAKHFHDEEAAYAYLEARIWPNGPVCPHGCGQHDRISKMGGKSTRVGLYKCYRCRKPFRATVQTVFESSHVPLRIWLQCVHLMASSKKGISSNQLARTLNVQLKTAWFMSHRVREAMKVLGMEPMGGAGKIVESDETYIGRVEGMPMARGGAGHKNAVLTLVERGGCARSFHLDNMKMEQIAPLVLENVLRESHLMTDEGRHYKAIGKHFAAHDAVRHTAGEYVRDGYIHSNTVENYYSIFKRGMKGVYQHCNEKHLHRYLAEFDFRYSNRVALGVNDVARADRALKGIVGKRLTYRTPSH